MLKTLAAATCAFALIASAADTIAGTWQLNTAKSKYTGTEMPKDLTVTYTPAGTGWAYEAKGTSATGQPINSSFKYVKDNEDITTTGFPHWDTIMLTNGNAPKGTGVLKRGGKKVGTVTRTISPDGKTMTIQGNLTAADGKKITYQSVYDKK